MRGNEDKQQQLFRYVSLEERVPADHPLRCIRRVVDEIQSGMSKGETAGAGEGRLAGAIRGGRLQPLAHAQRGSRRAKTKLFQQAHSLICD